MTPQQKIGALQIQSSIHQWVTIIGFPVLIYLVGDMYTDFKQMRNNDIRQDERIEHNRQAIQETNQSLQSLGNYVYRGIK